MESKFEYEHGWIDYEYIESDKTVELDLIMVDSEHRQEGNGTSLMAAFFAYLEDTYDFFAVRLTVCSETVSNREPGPSDYDLTKWYASFGFTVYDYVICNERECARMVILPSEMRGYLHDRKPRD